MTDIQPRLNRIKAICAKHGIATERPGDFKTMEECVEELSAKVAALEADRERLEGKLTEKSADNIRLHRMIAQFTNDA